MTAVALVLAGLLPAVQAAPKPKPPAPKPTPPPVLEGSVKGPDGKPLEGARILFRSTLARWTEPSSLVKTDDARPYGVSFAQASAVSSSENRWTVTTGPKISSWMISDFWSGPAMTVGA